MDAHTHYATKQQEVQINTTKQTVEMSKKRKADDMSDNSLEDGDLMDLLLEKESDGSCLYGFTPCQIKGVQHYDVNAKHHEWLTLVREPHNQYDSNAIRVNNAENQQIGHIDKVIAKRIRPIIDGDEETFKGMRLECFTLDTPDKYLIQSIVVFYGPEESKDEICNKIESMTQYVTEECPSCNKQVRYEQISKCYSCYNVGCNVECDFDVDGNCVTCDDEENAWAQYNETSQKVKKMAEVTKNAEISSMLSKLLDYMVDWQDKVVSMEDDILCRSDDETRHAAFIMDDCGDSVIREADWYSCTAEQILVGKKTI